MVYLWMEDDAPDGLFVVGECGHGLARRQVPHPDRGVIAACDDLGIGGLQEKDSGFFFFVQNRKNSVLTF